MLNSLQNWNSYWYYEKIEKEIWKVMLYDIITN